jgi:hypothetical protein
MMDANEQKVRAVWNVGRVTRMADICADESWHRFDSWADAAEFTESRLEEVRQLQEHVVLVAAQSIEWWRCMELEEPWTDRQAFWARGFVQFGMIASRLEAILAGLTRGMKPEAL